MRILFLTTSYPSWPGHGRGAFVHELARRLVARGHGVDVVAASFESRSREREEMDGVRVHRVPGGYGFTFEELRGASAWLWVALFLARGIGTALSLRRRWDVIHAQWDMPWGPAAVLLGKLLGISVVVTIRGVEEHRSRKQFPFRPLLSWTYRRSARVLAVAENARAEAAALGFSPPLLRLLRRGVDTQRFTPAPKDEALVRRLGLQDRRVILFVGDLIPRKGVPDLLEAFAAIAGGDPRATLLLVGSGPLEEGLRARIRQLNLERRVVWAGRVDYAEVPRWYSLADVFVLPTHADAATNAVMEAMACQRPVVTTSAMGWARELQEAGAVRIVPPKDSAALASAIRQLLEEGELSMSLARAGYRYVLQHHTWDAEVEEVLRCYAEAMAEGPRE